MADPLTVIGIIANIVQLVDFSCKVGHRLNQYRASVGELPKVFRKFSDSLPLLELTLKRTRETAEAGYISDEAQAALIPILDRCHKQLSCLEAHFELILPMEGDSYGRRIKKALHSLHREEKVKKIAMEIESDISKISSYHIADSSNVQKSNDQNEKLDKILKWLSAPDPSPNFYKALGSRQDGTGRWFLEGNKYTCWKTNAASLLWLFGKPGCGKTVLSSAIIQDLEGRVQGNSKRALGYYYFDFNDPQKQISRLLVQALICRLSRDCAKIPQILDSMFSSCGKGRQQPSPSALLEVLKQRIKDFEEVYIILDALDECDDRTELMEIIRTMVSWSIPGLHILLTSRKEADIENVMYDFLKLEDAVPLRSDEVNNDIRTYVRHTLAFDTSLRKWQKRQEDIELALMEKSDGMFQWAVCQLMELKKCLTQNDLEKALEGLPRTLDETYDRVLCGIDERYKILALRILQWLAFSARPLLVGEVAEIAAVDADLRRFDRKDILEEPKEAILRVCSSLVTVTTTDGQVRDGNQMSPNESSSSSISSENYTTAYKVVLAHYSVKEYLVSERISQSPAAFYGILESASHDLIARGCLVYLLQWHDGDSHEPLEDFRLALYSAQFWMIHRNLGIPASEETDRLLMEFFSRHNSGYVNWLRIHHPERRLQAFDKTGEVPVPLYYATLMGLDRIVNLLIEKGADVNSKYGIYKAQPLEIASRTGSIPIVMRLLEAGADVNAPDGAFGGSLQAAAYFGKDSIVEILLKCGADVHASTNPIYGTALHTAAEQGKKRTVDMLLAAGANVNARRGIYDTALQAASRNGHIEVVELLLHAGAQVNFQGGQFCTALHAASVNGSIRLVDKLLRAGAEVNVHADHAGRALHLACFMGHAQVVERLLEAGVDVNCQTPDEMFSTPLQTASRGEAVTVVELLLKKGAEVNAPAGPKYGSALQAASTAGNEAIVALLLDAGADANSRSGKYGSPLQGASYFGYDKVVEQLLAAGAEVNFRDEKGRSALDVALAKGRTSTAQRLRAAGAVDVQDVENPPQ